MPEQAEVSAEIVEDNSNLQVVESSDIGRRRALAGIGGFALSLASGFTGLNIFQRMSQKGPVELGPAKHTPAERVAQSTQGHKNQTPTPEVVKPVKHSRIETTTDVWQLLPQGEVIKKESPTLIDGAAIEIHNGDHKILIRNNSSLPVSLINQDAIVEFAKAAGLTQDIAVTYIDRPAHDHNPVHMRKPLSDGILDEATASYQIAVMDIIEDQFEAFQSDREKFEAGINFSAYNINHDLSSHLAAAMKRTQLLPPHKPDGSMPGPDEARAASKADFDSTGFAIQMMRKLADDKKLEPVGISQEHIIHGVDAIINNTIPHHH